MASGPGAQTATEGNGDGAHGSKRRRTDASGAAHPNSDAGGPTTAGDGSAAGSAAAQWAPPLESSPSATAVQPDASSRDWVAEPSPLLYCELCHNVFTDEPVSTVTCGHEFCRACLESKVSSPLDKCPAQDCTALLTADGNANAPLFSPRPRLKTLRAQLQAYCRFRKAAPGPGQPFEIDPEGCTASAMPLAELDSHQNSCGAAYVTCGMQCGGRECTHRCRRRALHNHKALCHFRLVPCPQGCGTSYQATEVGPHAVVCASRRVRCPFASCDMVLHAAEVPAHNAAFAQEHLRGLQAALDHSNALVTRLTPTAGLPTRVLKLLQDVATRKLAVDAAAASVADLACCASNAEMGAVIWVERGDSVAVHALSSYPEDAACAVHVAALDLLHAVVNAARAACAAAQKSGQGGAAATATGLRAAAIQNVGELYTAAADAAAAHILGSPGKRGACSHGPSVVAAVQVVAAVAEVMGGGAPVALTDKVHAAACKAVQAAPDSAVAAAAACRTLAVLLGLVAPSYLAQPPGLAQAESAAAAARAAMRKHGVDSPGVMLHASRVLQRSGLACTERDAPDDVACALAVLRAHRGDTAVGAAAMQVLRLACDAKGGPLPFLVAKGPQTVSDVIGASVVLDDKELVAAAASIVKRTCDPVAGGGDAAAAQWLDCGTPHWVTAALAPFAPRGTVVDVATSLAAVEAAMALLNQAQSPASVPAHDGREVSTLRQEAAHAFLGAGFAPALCKAIHTAAREHHAQLACVACMVVRKLGFGHASGAHAMAKSSVPEAVIKLLHSLDATVGGHVFPAWRGATYATAPEGEPVTAAAVGTCVLETAVLALSTFLDTAASAADGGGVANAFGVGAPPLNWAASAAIHVAELGALGVARSVADKLGTTKGHDTVDALAYALGVPESDMA